ncbi:hypothetical protein HN51_002062 [Arachis hypogaea]|nr:uncharacterized protein DS421_1g20650 [Arachis hypogaea]
MPLLLDSETILYQRQPNLLLPLIPVFLPPPIIICYPTSSGTSASTNNVPIMLSLSPPPISLLLLHSRRFSASTHKNLFASSSLTIPLPPPIMPPSLPPPLVSILLLHSLRCSASTCDDKLAFSSSAVVHQ